MLLYESGKTHEKRAEEILSALGFRSVTVEDAARGSALVEGDAPPDVVLVGIPGGEAIVEACRKVGEDRPSTVVAASGQVGEAAAMCERLGADLFVLRPYKRDGVGVVLHAAAVLREERRRVVKLENDLAAERTRLLRYGEVDPATGFHHFEFFKKLLVIELKRARRYGYPLAACLLAIDGPSLVGASTTARRSVHAQVARRVRSVIRDIDLPVDYADGRFLVFLPYTDLPGAERVGKRIEAGVRLDPPIDDGGRTIAPTVSVGVAAVKPGGQVSFARLIRAASVALRAAQLKGGGRVVVRP